MPILNTLAVFFTVLALTMGLPTPDAESDAFDMASHEVTVLLQQGKDESACADLAKSLIDEVTNKVDSANKLLANLDDGSDCSSTGQDAVTTAMTNKENAAKAATEAASAASSAADTEVDFGSYSFNALSEGTCAQFWSDPSYTAAKTAAAEAATAQIEAAAKAKAAEAPLQAAQEQAAKDVTACQCAVRATYNQAYSAATGGVEADAAAYTKGKNMQCVLAGTAAADCKVVDVPKLKEITLAEGVPAEVCTTPSPTPAPAPRNYDEYPGQPLDPGAQNFVFSSNEGITSPCNIDNYKAALSPDDGYFYDPKPPGTCRKVKPSKIQEVKKLYASRGNPPDASKGQTLKTWTPRDGDNPHGPSWAPYPGLESTFLPNFDWKRL